MSGGTRPVAVVTGANRGIGLEVCRQLAGKGYAVVLGSRDLGKGRRAAARMGDTVNITPCQLDVSDDGSVGAAARWVAERFGRCDALANNAAILYDIGARAETADLAVIHEAMETNLFGAWRTTLAPPATAAEVRTGTGRQRVEPRWLAG